jgi:hypothetical protein
MHWRNDGINHVRAPVVESRSNITILANKISSMSII